MDNIINKVISIDNEAKNIITKAEEKQENTENYVEEELKIRQTKIEEEMRKIINEKQKDYDYELKKQAHRIDIDTIRNLEKLKENYNRTKDKMLEDAYFKIINKRR